MEKVMLWHYYLRVTKCTDWATSHKTSHSPVENSSSVPQRRVFLCAAEINKNQISVNEELPSDIK